MSPPDQSQDTLIAKRKHNIIYDNGTFLQIRMLIIIIFPHIRVTLRALKQL